MVLELILAYGIVVGAIVGLSNVLPEYERDKTAAISEGKMKGAVDGENIGSILRQEDLISEKHLENPTNTPFHVERSEKAQSSMDQDEGKKEEENVLRVRAVKVTDNNDEGTGDKLDFSSEMLSSGYPDVFQDQGYVENSATFEKWAK